MANIPTPRSFNQIVGAMIDAFLASYGLKALKVGSPVLSILEAAAEADLRNSQDLFSLLRATTLAQAAGTALDRLAADEGLQRQTATFASGAVTVTTTSFTKISSSIYQGLPAPIAGVNVINVVDASSFPATGSIYLGRGTNNYEGPLAYTSATLVGVYWQIQLAVGVTTQNFHNVGESIIVAQGGNRQVTAGELVQTPQGNASTSTQFKVLYTATIPDGETEVDGVQVVAVTPGIGGNVQYNTITQFVSPPFMGAAVSNPLPFNNATNVETDDQLRERIREARATKTQGTVLAITTGVVGATSPDENKTIISSAFVLPQTGGVATLYIDDGTGYEEIFTGVALEQVVADANGGEQFFQIASDPPVTKARLVSSVLAPFSMQSGAILAVTVGGVLYQHTFSSTDFQNPLAATAFEVVASINRDATLGYQALASNNGLAVTIVAKADTNESLQIASDQLAAGAIDANASLGFPVGLTETMRLYKNDRLLSKDGQVASLQSRPVSEWGLFNSVETLVLEVDGTASPVQVPLVLGTGTGTATSFTVTATQIPIQPNTVVVLLNGAPVGADNGSGVIVGSSLGVGSMVNYTTGAITVNFLTAPASGAAISAYYVSQNNGPVPVYTFTAQSFINAGTAYTSVGLNSLAAWAAVFNATIPGITATYSGSSLTLTSNLGTSSRASLVISGGTLLGKIFNLGSSQGSANDYTLNRNWGQISLVAPLSAGDTLSIGSLFTRAFIQSPSIPLTSTSSIPNITGSSGANWWFITDGQAEVIKTGMAAGTQLTYSVTALENWGARIRLTSTSASPIFANVDFRDWLVMWDPGLATNNQGQWRVDNVDPLGTWVEIGRQSGFTTGAGMTATVLQDGTVLIAGGLRPKYYDASGEAAIYNPTTGTLTPVGKLNTPRGYHKASLIPTGTYAGYVLVTGGLAPSQYDSPGFQVLSSCELYNPTTQTWAVVAPMPGALAGHAQTVLDSNGGSLANWVVVAGGFSAIPSTYTAAAYYYNPSANTWTALPNMLQARAYHQMTYVSAGSPAYILVSGGTNSLTGSFMSECEKLDLTALTWSTTGSLNTGRYAHKTKVLGDGTIIAVGGFYLHTFRGTYATNTAETFNGSTWTNVATTNLLHVLATGEAIASSGGDPQMLLSGGIWINPFTILTTYQSSEIYDKNTNTWTVISNALQPSRYDAASAKLPGNQQVLIVGGSTGQNAINELGVSTPLTTASAEVYTTVALTSPINGVTPAAGTWYAVLPSTTLGLQTLNVGGAVVARSLGYLQKVNVPAMSNVLAPILQAAFSAQLKGASAVVYQTDTVRVQTDTYALTGDIALVTADSQAAQFNLPTGNAIENLPSHQAAVTTGGSDLGTPNFLSMTATSVFSPTQIQVTTGSFAQEGNQYLNSGSTIVGLEGFYDENYPSGLLTVLSRMGSNFGFTSTLFSQVPGVGQANSLLTLRTPAAVEWLPQDRVYAASPWCLSPQDTLTVVLDQNPENLRFVIPMYRRLQPAGSAYGTTNAFLDKDNPTSLGAPQSLALAFGNTTTSTGFDFSDFAVFMHARAITNPSSTQAILWRYYRFGPEGNLAQIRFDYPKTPSTPVAVFTDFYGRSIGGTGTAQEVNISVTLPSAAARTGMRFRPSTRVGCAVLNNQGPNSDLYKYVYAFGLQVSGGTRASGVTTLTLTLPPGITNHGLTVGTNIYLKSSDPNFATQTYNINAVTATTITYNDSGSPTTYTNSSNFGEISYDNNDANLGVSTIQSGDIFTANASAFGTIQGGPQTLGTFSGSTLTLNPTLAPGFIRGGTLVISVGGTPVAQDNGVGVINPLGSYPVSGTVHNYNYGTITVTLQSTLGLMGAVTAAWTAQPTAFQNVTMSLQYYDGQQVFEGYADTSPVAFGTGTTLQWFPAGNTANFSWYPVDTGNNSVTQIVSAVNTLAAATNSIVPVTAYALPGSTGSISLSTTDSTLMPIQYTAFTDGINYVQSTSIPATNSGNYSLTFKNPINGALATNSDWQDEEVRIAPLNAATLVRWLNSQAVTGLGNNASVQVAGSGHTVVIASDTPGSAGAVQVQGGSANFVSAPVVNFGLAIPEQDAPGGEGDYMVVSVNASAATGIVAGSYCALQNSNTMPRTLPINSTTTLSSYGIDSNGFVELQSTGAAVATIRVRENFTCWQVETQGEFVAYAWNGIGTAPNLNSVQEGDYVFVNNTNSVPSASEGIGALTGVDCGLWRIVRVDPLGTVFWVENSAAVAATGWANIVFIANDSLLPGDQLIISTPVWGAANQGTWTVVSVGIPASTTDVQYANTYWFQIQNTATGQPPTAFQPTTVTALGTNAQLVQVYEGTPSRLIKNLMTIAPNQVNGTLMDLKFDSDNGYTKVGVAAGTLVQPLDKLNFPTGIVQGLDGYAHSVGLVGEANKVVYGDTQDSATYPGIAAAGANINISGPFIHRITMSLVIRINTSTTTQQDVQEQVQSAVASYINGLATGTSVSIAGVVAVVEAVFGVTGVAVVYPTYGPGNDQIAIQPFERAQVLALSDISVSFANQ